jgi:hypothetical protein
MEADLQSQVAFYLTGRRPAEPPEAGLDAIDGLALRPALLARYRDLSALRYDFPVVLVRDATGADCIRSLSGAMDELLKEAAPPGIDGERVRKHVIRLEREIRALLSRGAAGTLSALWDLAADSLQAADGAQAADSLKRARAALKIDGELLPCNEATPARVLAHAWGGVQADKAKRLRERIGALVLRLSDILKAEWAGSEAGRSARSLKASIGTAHEDVFDFDAMSRMLSRATHGAEMPESRRARIRRLLSIFESQRFVSAQRSPGEQGDPLASSYPYLFQSCAAAAKAYRERLPKLSELAMAIEAAELEISGVYREATHDPIFAAYGENGLDAEDLAAFPDYLVCAKADDRAETAGLMELLSAGLPVKVLVQSDDLLEESPLGDGHLTFGLRTKQLTDMAIGLNSVYVLQSSASNLVRCRESILRGMKYAGPALFSVFSGAAGKTNGLSPYLVSAAAMEARLFPAFAYDPGAGTDWASRFHVDDNSQVDRDWPSQAFSYADADHQRITEEVDFTLLDFVACDARYARHFARVPRAKWNGGMIPVRESLQRQASGLPDRVPCLLMVDANDTLQKVIVDDKLIQEARRCSSIWRSLRELGGVRNSHAERLLARERQAWEAQGKILEQQKAPESDAQQPQPKHAGPPPAQGPAPAEPERQPSTGEPYIETPRCTSCDECTRLNNRMFAYDANKQAFIANPDAGSYRELVEAAENCQVSIIHPGKPRNPNEPGLDELQKRAEAFS